MTATRSNQRPTQQSPLQRPTTVAQTADLLRESRGSVLIRGGGTKLGWAGRVADPDLVLDTRDLRGVLTHNPADMTASVRAGTTLTELQQRLAGDNQWLALDPPTEDAGATIGGLLAAGDSGPSRLRYGGLRDLVIGVTLVLADGTVARSGGHVIKNVAGYDLAKLAYGSLGSLAVVAEVVVRLHPRPAETVTLRGAADAGQACTAALGISASGLEPAAVEWVSSADPFGAGDLLIRVDGSAAGVAAAVAGLTALLATVGIAADALSSSDAERAWGEHATAAVGQDAPQETLLRVAGLPSDLTTTAADATQAAERAGLTVGIVSSAALGLHTVRFTGGNPAAHAAAVTSLRDRSVPLGAAVVLRQHSPELDEVLDVLGPPPSAVSLLARIKDQFDPAGRLAPGRFRPWF